MYLNPETFSVIVCQTRFTPGEHNYTLTDGDTKVEFTSPVPLSRENITSTVITTISQAVETHNTSFADYFENSHGKSLQQAYDDYTSNVTNFNKLFNPTYTGIDREYEGLDIIPAGMSIREFSHYLTDHATEINREVEKLYHLEDYRHPQLPEDSNYVSLTSLTKDLDLGKYAGTFDDYFFEDTTLEDAIYNCADNNTDISWYALNQWMTDQDHIDTFEETLEEGLIDTRDFDYHQAVQTAQAEHMRNELTEHKEDLIKMAGWERAAELGIYALERNTAEKAGELLFDNVDLTDEQMTRDTLNSSIDANLTEMINEQLPEEQQIEPNELQEWIKQNPRNPLFVSLEGARMESTTLKNAAEKLGIKVGDPVEKEQTKAQAQVSVENSTNLTKEDMSIQASEDHSPDANTPDPTSEKVSESSPVVHPLGKEGIRNMIAEQTQQKIQHVETQTPLTQQQEQQQHNR